jgi:very-short-patch-repair endonuclease
MYWQDEKNRKKKSEWRKQLHKDYPETHPNRRLAGNRNRMSFPERLVFDYLTELNIKFDHQKKVEGFYPDFVIGQLIIEVDGERWHCRKKDNDRDQVLTEAGFRVVRFPVGKQKDLIKRVDEFLTKEKLK